MWKTVAIPQTQFINRSVDALLVQKIRKTVEMLQVQVFDEIANVPVGWMDRCSRFRSADHRADPEGYQTVAFPQVQHVVEIVNDMMS